MSSPVGKGQAPQQFADSSGQGAIVAAVDGSPASLVALRQAAALAAALGLRLQVVYVEDEELLRLGAMPFSREVGAYTAAIRTLERAGLEREMQALALRVQRAAAEVAAIHGLMWRFDSRRGQVADELAAAAQNAALLCVGRVGRLAGRIGSTPVRLTSRAQSPLLVASTRTGARLLPLTVLDTGSEAAQRTWDFAKRLASALVTSDSPGPLLHIVALREATAAAHKHAEQAEAQGLAVVLTSASPESARNLLQRAVGVVLLPEDDMVRALIDTQALPPSTVLLVP